MINGDDDGNLLSGGEWCGHALYRASADGDINKFSCPFYFADGVLNPMTKDMVAQAITLREVGQNCIGIFEGVGVNWLVALKVSDKLEELFEDHAGFFHYPDDIAWLFGNKVVHNLPHRCNRAQVGQGTLPKIGDHIKAGLKISHAKPDIGIDPLRLFLAGRGGYGNEEPVSFQISSNF